MRELPQVLQTTYSNLLQIHLNRPAFEFDGAPFIRKLNNKTYWYANHRAAPGAPLKQSYLGPDTEEMRARIEEMKRQRQILADFREHASAQVAILRGGGIAGPDRRTGPILRALSNSGVFRLGGTLVGTQAFRLYDLVLGVFLTEEAGWVTQTNDIDIASFEHLAMAIEDTTNPDLVKALSGLGFGPAPTINHKTPTRWALPDATYFVDFFTPSFAADEKPTRLPTLNLWAQSLHYLNFLIRDPMPAVVPYMEGLLVQIPRPERYAIHKLIVSQVRRGENQDKKRKDVAQARALIWAMAEDRPYELKNALAEADAMGEKWRKALDQALDVRFQAPALHHDFDRDIVWFEGTALGDTPRFAISQEALNDHFNNDARSGEDLTRAVNENRSAIYVLLKRKFRTEPGRETILTTDDVNRFSRP
jgi:hypothetical protein